MNLTNVIMLLGSFSHVAEMLRPIDVIRLELQNMKNMKVINPLMLNGQSHKSYKEWSAATQLGLKT